MKESALAGGAAAAQSAPVRPVKGEGCWQRPRRQLEKYTTALIEGTDYLNTVEEGKDLPPRRTKVRTAKKAAACGTGAVQRQQRQWDGCGGPQPLVIR